MLRTAIQSLRVLKIEIEHAERIAKARGLTRHAVSAKAFRLGLKVLANRYKIPSPSDTSRKPE